MRQNIIRILAIAAISILAVSAVQTHRPLTNVQIKKIQTLKEGNSWGSLLVNLAEMHALAEGPIEDLIVAI
jgi:vacuolar-type H+-ATPase subunit I/STV1